MRREHCAWLLPCVGGGLVSGFEKSWASGLGESRATAAFFFAGIALGWAWYRLYPRSLAERLAGLMILVSLLTLVAFWLGPAVIEVDWEQLGPADVIPMGVVAGLVLTERWPSPRAESTRIRRRQRI